MYLQHPACLFRTFTFVLLALLPPNGIEGYVLLIGLVGGLDVLLHVPGPVVQWQVYGECVSKVEKKNF